MSYAEGPKFVLGTSAGVYAKGHRVLPLFSGNCGKSKVANKVTEAEGSVGHATTCSSLKNRSVSVYSEGPLGGLRLF